jgi:uncharacterized coiled-coil protein SlyX
MWPFSRQDSPTTTKIRPGDALEVLQRLEARVETLEVQSTAQAASLADLERQGRLDHLELLDVHERVKKSLGKLNRRKRELQETDVDDPDHEPAQAQPQPRLPSLLSRRGRG